jgi:glycine/D-amino acid oxidase-like deaminating enzyme
MNPSPGSLPNSVDVVIIGGGVIGSVTAYVLAKAKIRVLVIEQQDIGSGTSSSAAAAALLQTKTSVKKLALANQSLKLLDKLHEQLDGRFEFAHTGSLLAACTENEMQLIQDMNANLSAMGLDVELLDGQQVQKVMPILGNNILGGSYSPKDAQINPLELVVACSQAAMVHGAIFSTFNELKGIEILGDKIVAVQTSAGRVLTDTVINAAGVWAPRVAEMAGVTVPVSPLKGELLVTERTPPQLRGTLIAAKYLLSKAKAEGEGEASGEAPKRSVGITLVQVANGNFIVGSTRELADYDKRSTYEGIRELVHQLLELTPKLANVHLLRAYAGLRPLTPDGSPIISRTPGLPGLIHTVGFGGDGLAMSAITAEMILGLLTDSADEALLANFTLERFRASEEIQ